MRVLGLDVGEKTIGLALSDELQIVASALCVIHRKGHARDMEKLREYVEVHSVSKLVFGMPRRTDGSYGKEAEGVERFAKKVQEALALPIEFFDERFSTVSATRALIAQDVRREKRRTIIDQVAASIILQTYLDYQNQKKKEGAPMKKDQGMQEPVDSTEAREDAITLVDEEGVESQYYVFDYVELDGVRYCLLEPCESGDEEDTVTIVLMRLEKDEDGQDILVYIDNDEEFDRVLEAIDEGEEDMVEEE